MKKFTHDLERGQAMMVATMFFLAVTISVIFGLVGPIVGQQKIAAQLLSSRQSYFLAEAGVEDMMYRLINNYPVGISETLTLNGSSATTISTDTLNGKDIVATGDVNDSIRRVEVSLGLGTGITFHTGIHIGSGGFTLSNNAGVIGNVYSNSSITGSNGAFVTESATAVNGISNLVIGTSTQGNATAPSVTNSTVRGTLYCQTGSGNNKACNTNFTPPAVREFVIPDEQITEWKTEAAAAETFVGNMVVDGTDNVIGPLKVQGDLTLDIAAEARLIGTVWVTGNLFLSNNARIALDPSFEDNEGIIITDGTATLSNGASLDGTGEEDSFMMLLTTSSSATAVSLSNNTGGVIIYAPNGTVQLSNNAQISQVSAKNFSLMNNATVEYESGIIDASFISGPSAGYEIRSWKEVE
jgi:hypothetical protein